MSPASIGLWMAGYGIMSGVIQFVAFPSINGRFGPWRVFIASIFSFFPDLHYVPLSKLGVTTFKSRPLPDNRAAYHAAALSGQQLLPRWDPV